MADDPQNEVHDALLAEAGWVRGLARSLVEDGHAAEDLAQDALTAAVEESHRLREGKLRAWLRGAVRRIAARRRRDRKARYRRERHAAKPLAGNPDAEAVERLRLHKRLTEAVLSLPEPYRSVVISRYFDEKSPAEIARERDLRPELVRQQIHRALAMLRARLDRELGDRHAWSTALLGLWKDPVATAGTLLGVTLMKKIAIAAAAVLLFAVVYQVWEGSEYLPDSTLSQPVTARTAEGIPDAPGESEIAAQRDRVVLPPAAPDQSLELEIVDDRGIAVPGARTWYWSEGSPITGRGTTDSEGRATLAGTSGSGSVVVVADGRVAESWELDDLRGVHRLVLEPGEVLQGWVRVDGEVPREPITLQVTGNRSPIPDHIPEELLAEISELGSGETQAVTTAADGSFRLGGLPSTWTGRMSLKMWGIHWFRTPGLLEANGPWTVLLPEPQVGLQLELTELPVVQGRLVWSDTLSGVPKASLMIRAWLEDGVQTPGLGASTDRDGRFRVGISPSSLADQIRWTDPSQREAFKRVEIQVRSGDAIAELDLEIPANELDPSGDVGTILLDRKPIMHFVVRDGDEHPIPGAFVQGDSVSEPTDEEGRGTVGRIDGPYTVGSMGFLIEKLDPVSGSGSVEDPFTFILRPGNELILRLIDGRGGVPEIEEIEILARGSFFSGRGGSWWMTDIHRALFGDTPHSGGYMNEVAYFRFGIGTDGRVVLPSMEPHAKFTINVRGALRETAVTQEAIGPAPGETKEIEVLVPQEPFEVSGQVLDDLNRLLPNAVVRVRLPDDGGSTSGRTRDDGTFLFEPVFLEQRVARLEAYHPGFASTFLEDVTLGPETGPVTLRLEKGHDLTVTVADPTGAIVPVRWVGIDGIPEPLNTGAHGIAWSTSVEPGKFRYEDLPSGAAVFWCEVAGQRYEAAYDIHEGTVEARITVPEMGTLAVFVPEDTETEHRPVARIVSLDEPGVEVERDLFLWLDRSYEFVLPPGDYDVSIDDVHRVNTEEVSRRPVHGPVRVTIRAREQTECRM